MRIVHCRMYVFLLRVIRIVFLLCYSVRERWWLENTVCLVV